MHSETFEWSQSESLLWIVRQMELVCSCWQVLHVSGIKAKYKPKLKVKPHQCSRISFSWFPFTIKTGIKSYKLCIACKFQRRERHKERGKQMLNFTFRKRKQKSNVEILENLFLLIDYIKLKSTISLILGNIIQRLEICICKHLLLEINNCLVLDFENLLGKPDD